MITKSTYGTMYYVNDMKKSVAYYVEKLRLKPTFESAEWTEFDVGGHNLCLHAKRPGQEKYADNGVLIFNAEGTKALYEKMKGEGLEVFGLHEVHPAAWSFHLKDPNGNELSLYGAP